MKIKILVALSVIGLILAFTNPSPADFSSFIASRKLPVSTSPERKHNFIFFSTYIRNYTLGKPYLSPKMIQDADSIVHLETEKPYYETPKYKKNFDKIFDEEATKNPNLTKESFARNMQDDDLARAVYLSLKKSGKLGQPTFKAFIRYYGFSTPLPRTEVRYPRQHQGFDTLYQKKDTSASYLGIVKNFF